MAVSEYPDKSLKELLSGDDINKSDFVFYLTQIVELINRNEVQFGSGSPNGVVTANTGGKYFDTAAASGSNYYIKTTDNVNTGWVLV